MSMRMKSFKKILEDKDWAELGSRAPSLHPDKASKALRQVYKDPTVPAQVIGSLLKNLFLYRSAGTGTAYKLASFVKPGPNVDPFCCDVCIDATPAVLGEFLKVLPGLYKTSRGQEYKWPSPQAARWLVDAIWYHALKDIGDPEKLLSVLSQKELRELEEINDLWAKTELILMAATGRDIEMPSDCGSGPWLVIHAAAAVSCSTPVIWFGLKLFPDQIRTRDHRGRFPLHYAMMDLSHTCVKIPEAVQDDIPCVNLTLYLISLFPAAAKAVDLEGKLPLTIALESRKWWPQESKAKIDSGEAEDAAERTEMFKLRLLLSLVRAAPNALTSRDLETHLWPFLRASVEGAPLTTVYKLLRANPAPIQHRQEESTQTILRKRILTLEEEAKLLRDQLEEERDKTRRLENEVKYLTSACKVVSQDTETSESEQGATSSKRLRSSLE